MVEVEPPPKDTSIIGLAYDFGPDGATFAIIGVVMSAPESELEPEVPVAVFHISELDISPSEVDIG